MDGEPVSTALPFEFISQEPPVSVTPIADKKKSLKPTCLGSR
jgi:hypothetical protein